MSFWIFFTKNIYLKVQWLVIMLGFQRGNLFWKLNCYGLRKWRRGNGLEKFPRFLYGKFDFIFSMNTCKDNISFTISILLFVFVCRFGDIIKDSMQRTYNFLVVSVLREFRCIIWSFRLLLLFKKFFLVCHQSSVPFSDQSILDIRTWKEKIFEFRSLVTDPFTLDYRLFTNIKIDSR